MLYPMISATLGNAMLLMECIIITDYVVSQKKNFGIIKTTLQADHVTDVV